MTRKKKIENTDQDIFYDIHESLTGDTCPVCGYPIVLEEGLEVCYGCGWYRGCEESE